MRTFISRSKRSTLRVLGIVATLALGVLALLMSIENVTRRVDVTPRATEERAVEAERTPNPVEAPAPDVYYEP